MIALTVTGALCATAYIVGRARPLKRARDWAAWQAWRMNFKPGWRGRAKALLVLGLNPDLVASAFWRKWRNRTEPTLEPVELRLSPEWQARVDQARARVPESPEDEDSRS